MWSTPTPSAGPLEPEPRRAHDQRAVPGSCGVGRRPRRRPARPDDARREGRAAGCHLGHPARPGDAFDQTAARELLADGIGHVTRIGASTGLRPGGLGRSSTRSSASPSSRPGSASRSSSTRSPSAGSRARDATSSRRRSVWRRTWDPVTVGRGRRRHPPPDDRGRGPPRRSPPCSTSPAIRAGDGSRRPTARTRTCVGRSAPRTSGASRATILPRRRRGHGKHFLGYAMSDGRPEPRARPPRSPGAAGGVRRAVRRRHPRRRAGIGHELLLVGRRPAVRRSARAILTELLRDELGFAASVVADYFAVPAARHHHASPGPSRGRGAGAVGRARRRAPGARLLRRAPRARRRAGRTWPRRDRRRGASRAARRSSSSVCSRHPYVDEGAAAAAFDTGGAAGPGAPGGRRSRSCS